jgi:Pao retrotransposon peptidase.
LIGFTDASQQAYGACIFERATNNDNIIVNLLTSKSKVAPLKITTIPKLELCVALLLSKLAKCMSRALDIPASNVYMFFDCKVVLSWLKSEPQKWEPFVANHVSAIQQAVASATWR